MPELLQLEISSLQEQDEWFQREQELLQRIEEVNEKNTKILQIERVGFPMLKMLIFIEFYFDYTFDRKRK